MLQGSVFQSQFLQTPLLERKISGAAPCAEVSSCSLCSQAPCVRPAWIYRMKFLFVFGLKHLLSVLFPIVLVNAAQN